MPFLLSQASKSMHEPIVPMIFPVLGAHVIGAKFMYPDLIWKELCGRKAISHHTLAYLRCRNDALRFKKASKITFTYFSPHFICFPNYFFIFA